jgi:hypothetical protein
MSFLLIVINLAINKYYGQKINNQAVYCGQILYLARET